MNKYISYSLLAILLGIITITAPITLFNIKDNQNTPYEEDNESRFLPEGVGNTLNQTTNTNFVSSHFSILNSIGLLVVPSFLVALGVFVLIRKKIS